MAVIVINQQLGSRGAELGQLAARELGYRYMGRADLITEASRIYQVDPEQFMRFDEREPRFWERSKIDNERLIWFLRAVCFREMARDKMVYVSSYGAHLLPENGCGLRVRTIAALPKRIAFIAGSEKLSEAAAEKRVREHDREVRARAATLWGIDIDDAQIYHLVLNTSNLPLETLCATLMTCAQKVSAACPLSGWGELRDMAVAAQVRAGLLSHPKFGHAQVEVHCKAGAVQVFGPGLVAPWDDLVRQVTDRIEGVKSLTVGAHEPPLPLRSE